MYTTRVRMCRNLFFLSWIIVAKERGDVRYMVNMYVDPGKGTLRVSHALERKKIEDIWYLA